MIEKDEEAENKKSKVADKYFSRKFSHGKYKTIALIAIALPR